MPAVVYMKNDQSLPLIEKPRRVVDDDMMYFCHEDDADLEQAQGASENFDVDTDASRTTHDSGYDQTDSSESSVTNNRRDRTQVVSRTRHTSNGIKGGNTAVKKTESLDSFLPHVPDSPVGDRRRENLSEELRLNLSDTSIISQQSRRDDTNSLPRNPVNSLYSGQRNGVANGNKLSPRGVNGTEHNASVVRPHPLKVSFEDDSGVESFRNESDREREKAVRKRSEVRKRASEEPIEELVTS